MRIWSLELASLFAHLVPDRRQLWRTYDIHMHFSISALISDREDQSGHLEFDEFVQMMTEISNF